MSTGKESTTVEERDGRVVVRVPMRFKRRGGRKEIVVPEGLQSPSARKKEPGSLFVAIARARHWLNLLENGRYPTVTALAHALGIDRSYVSRVLRLALLAPDIVQAISTGAEPSGLTFRSLTYKVPRDWSEQRGQHKYSRHC